MAVKKDQLDIGIDSTVLKFEVLVLYQINYCGRSQTWRLRCLQSRLILLVHPLQEVRGKVGDDNVSSGPSHRGQDLHQGWLEVERSGLGAVVQHGVLARHLQWIHWMLNEAASVEDGATYPR